jgi:hypothetical protein
VSGHEDRIAASAKSQGLVVFSILRDSACGECNKELGKGALPLMEADRPLCLSCADLDHLIYLPRGDAALTRRAAIVDDSILGRLSWRFWQICQRKGYAGLRTHSISRLLVAREESQ